eukprot:9477811-Pyramimonas_sp.AAC.2
MKLTWAPREECPRFALPRATVGSGFPISYLSLLVIPLPQIGLAPGYKPPAATKVFLAKDVFVVLEEVSDVPMVYLRTEAGQGTLPPLSGLEPNQIARVKRINDRCKF